MRIVIHMIWKPAGYVKLLLSWNFFNLAAGAAKWVRGRYHGETKQ